MQSSALIAALVLAVPACGAQTKQSAAIPATPPTQSVSDLPSAHMPVLAASTGATRVVWNGAELTIEANGEPMPEVLGRVARETGMKITGGVPDEHLYGTYGPGSVQSVLGQLFDGLSVNMMLVNDSPTSPKELILTARTGGATPPSTRQVADTWQPRRRPETIRPIVTPGGQRPPVTNAAPVPGSGMAQPAFPAVSAPPSASDSATNPGNAAATPDATTDTNSSTEQPQSPNGVKTPEQIFEELRKRAAAKQTQ